MERFSTTCFWRSINLLLLVHPLTLSPSRMPVENIQYSEKYSDDRYEYRHVILPLDIARHVPKTHLMTETEWRNLGVQQSPGWVHYMMHGPEPHVLLFRRMRTDIVPAPRCTALQREQTVVYSI
ncbi:cyclin-dependent kinases regulatory subunit isoform X2 [Temnothorax longispinosus]|uniref:cyclin-dependent kinases regulatory subunit isoform X2 n=1 Tax=Temnothorax longispinosus TaxID=300112 RepID=UPI003A99990D